MTKAEALLVCVFLDDLFDKYSNAGCNDLSIPNTPDNRLIVEAAESECDDEYEGLFITNRQIHTQDNVVCGYIQRKLMVEFGIKQEQIDKQRFPG